MSTPLILAISCCKSRARRGNITFPFKMDLLLNEVTQHGGIQKLKIYPKNNPRE